MIKAMPFGDRAKAAIPLDEIPTNQDLGEKGGITLLCINPTCVEVSK